MAENINPRGISLYSVFADVDSTTPEVRLRPRPDVAGEQLIRKSTISAIESLLTIRDHAAALVQSAKPGTYPDLQRVLGYADSEVGTGIFSPGGDVSVTIAVSGTKDPATGDFHVGKIESMEFIRDRKRIDLPFFLAEGERMIATIVRPGGEGESDEVVGRSEVVGPVGGTDVTEVKLTPVLRTPRTSPLAAGCSTCGKALEPGERPAVEETAESAGSSPRRWMCGACVMSGLVGSSEKPPEGGPDVVGRIPGNAAPAIVEEPKPDPATDPEKFDETTGPMETRG